MSEIFAYMCDMALLSKHQRPRGGRNEENGTMSYYRSGFSSYAEFKREANFGSDRLGKEELELLRALEQDDDFFDPDRDKKYRSPWD
jgi:hypothetical protein